MKPGLPLGIVQDAEFDGETVPFEPGGTLALFTDGLIETPRLPDPIHTPDFLRELLNAHSGSAAEVSHKITDSLFFKPSIEVEDDLTLIVARHTGQHVAASVH